MDVLIFRTSVSSRSDFEQFTTSLNAFGKWTFDLDALDRILRIESDQAHTEAIMKTLWNHGFCCEELWISLHLFLNKQFGQPNPTLDTNGLLWPRVIFVIVAIAVIH